MTWLGWYSHEYGALTGAALGFLTGLASVATAIISFRFAKSVSRAQTQGQERQFHQQLFDKRYSLIEDFLKASEGAFLNGADCSVQDWGQVEWSLWRLHDKGQYLFGAEVSKRMLSVRESLQEFRKDYASETKQKRVAFEIQNLHEACKRYLNIGADVHLSTLSEPKKRETK